VQDAREQIDDPVAVVVAVPVVEFLEVVEVGIADGEFASSRARCSAGEKIPVITSSAPAPNQDCTCSGWWSAARTVTGTMAVNASIFRWRTSSTPAGWA
jgi:hypothetical protein